MTITVLKGDIALVVTNALIMPVSTNQGHAGQVDQVFKDLWQQLTQHKAKLQEGQVIAVERPKDINGSFGCVLFVVDNQILPLGRIVALALEQADKLQKATVSLSVMRANATGELADQDLKELVGAVNVFVQSKPEHVVLVKIVVPTNDLRTKIFQLMR